MKSKTERVYFNELWVKMKAHLKAFINNGDQEELQHFRIQVKKLKAMLLLLDASSKKQLLNHFKPIKKIFKKGGQIRDAYLNMELCLHYHLDNTEFISGRQTIIDNGTQQFELKKEKYRKTLKKAHAALETAIKPVSNSYINTFFITELDEITLTLNNLPFNELLHTCRRRIKTLMYNYKFAYKALEGKLHLDIEYLDKLQDHIGKLHDNILAVELLSTAGINDQFIIAKLNRQNIKHKKTITRMCANFSVKATGAEQQVVEY